MWEGMHTELLEEARDADGLSRIKQDRTDSFDLVICIAFDSFSLLHEFLAWPPLPVEVIVCNTNTIVLGNAEYYAI